MLAWQKQQKQQETVSDTSQVGPSQTGWEKTPFKEFQRGKDFTCTLFKNYMLVFGGLVQKNEPQLFLANTEDCSDALFMLDLEQSTWRHIEIKAPIRKRYGHTACLYRDNQFIIYGGKSGNNTMIKPTEMQILDLDEVETTYAMKSTSKPGYSQNGQAHHTAHIYQNYMFIIGGEVSDSEFSKDIEVWRFDLDTNSWYCPEYRDESNPGQRYGHCSLLIQDKIFLYGGRSQNQNMFFNDLWFLDLQTEKWKKIKHMLHSGKKPTTFSSMEYIGSTLYIFGGQTPNNYTTNTIHSYDTSNDAFKQVWSKITTPNVSHHKSVYYKGSIYLLDAQANSPILRLRIENAPLNTDNQQKKVLKGKDTDYISHFNKLFLDKTYSDISFCVEEQEIPAHKNILAVRCHYFHNMFSSGMVESQTAKIDIPDIQLPTFKALLEFIYCNQVGLDEDLALDLLEVSDKYSFTELSRVCEVFLGQQLNSQNYVKLAHAAEKLQANGLRKSVIAFVIKNRNLIERNGEPGDLPKSLLWEIIFGIGKM